MKFDVKKGDSVVYQGSIVHFKNDVFETGDKDLIKILEDSIVAKKHAPKPNQNKDKDQDQK